MAILTSNKQIADAIKRSKSQHFIAAIEARYFPRLDVFELKLSDGGRAFFPRERQQGLQHGTRRQLANVEIVGGGSGLHWPDLGADLLVEGLMRGVYGNKQWMSDLGRIGGSARSWAKGEAARRNGLKGGRPKGRKRVVA